VADARRRTTARRDLERLPHFTRLSPRPGHIDEEAVHDLLGDDPGAALTLLAEMTGAVDPAVRELARRLAGRITVRVGGSTPTRRGGPARLTAGPVGPDGDLDLDASLGAVLEARAARRRPSLDELSARRWARRAGAVALVVDRSGSMGGARLATAALAAAVVATRVSDDYSVIAFAADAVVVKALHERRPPEAVVDDLLALRGHGPTDLALGLRVAGAQLAAMAGRGRRVILLLSDCRANVPGDPLTEARAADETVVLAPAGDADEARAFAAACGGRWAEVATPMDVPAALASLLA
jgi:Mg-chelatase subunit ChlD